MTYRRHHRNHGKAPVAKLGLGRATCASGKIRYPTEWAANQALEDLKAKDTPRHLEQRAYHDPQCGGWHLTSKAYRP